jgi:hypothetical protein
VGIVPIDGGYATLLGRFIYSVSYLECLVLGDLPRLPALPDELDAAKLAGKTTTEIGIAIEKHLAGVGDADVQRWLRAAAHSLQEVGPPRNDALHARPATWAGRQRLLRWRGPAQPTFPITDECLTQQTTAVERHITELYALRVARL